MSYIHPAFVLRPFIVIMLHVILAQKDYICLEGLYLSFVKQIITNDKSLASVLRFKSNLS